MRRKRSLCRIKRPPDARADNTARDVFFMPLRLYGLGM